MIGLDERRRTPTISLEPAPRELIYIIGTYPLLTTTFIDREIMSLRRSGIVLRVIAIRRPPVDTPLSADQKALQQGVTYLIPIHRGRLLLGHVYFAVFRPRRFFGALAYLLTRPHPSLKARIKSLLHFGEGVYAAFVARNMSCDEFHAHFADRAATVALVAGRLLDKPYSLSIHAGADIFVDPVLLREKIRGARHVVTCTSYNLSYVAALAGEDLRSKMSHVHHGLDLSLYRPGSPAAVDPPLILSVGQLAERKGFDQLVRACRRLADEGYRFHCRILGEGPHRELLEGLIDRLSLQRFVELRGALSHAEVLEHYRQATMFVLPCIRTPGGDIDGIPNVLAEAMASQIPVVSSDLPAIRELVLDGENGLLVPAGDEEALAAAMRRLLDEPTLRQALGTRGRETVHEIFDVEVNVRRFAATMWPRWFDQGEGRADA
jgi:colanic acid/amylovoran biosynthesis glycosyltransferase